MAGGGVCAWKTAREPEEVWSGHGKGGRGKGPGRGREGPFLGLLGGGRGLEEGMRDRVRRANEASEGAGRGRDSPATDVVACNGAACIVSSFRQKQKCHGQQQLLRGHCDIDHDSHNSISGKPSVRLGSQQHTWRQDLASM